MRDDMAASSSRLACYRCLEHPSTVVFVANNSQLIPTVRPRDPASLLVITFKGRIAGGFDHPQRNRCIWAIGVPRLSGMGSLSRLTLPSLQKPDDLACWLAGGRESSKLPDDEGGISSSARVSATTQIRCQGTGIVRCNALGLSNGVVHRDMGSSALREARASGLLSGKKRLGVKLLLSRNDSFLFESACLVVWGSRWLAPLRAPSGVPKRCDRDGASHVQVFLCGRIEDLVSEEGFSTYFAVESRCCPFSLRSAFARL